MTSHPEFNASTNATDVAKVFSDSIKGKSVLITGVAPNGIGQATAHAIAAHEPSLIIISGRSREKLDASLASLHTSFPSVPIRELIMDLASQKSVRAAAAQVNAYTENIDILINNAGVMAIPKRTLTEDGVEMQFGTNHIGHFLFTNLILPKLKAAAQSATPGATRVINVSSWGHNFSPFRFSDYNFDGKPVPRDEAPDQASLQLFKETGKVSEGYHPWVAYGQSKTANILFSAYLATHLSRFGIQSFGLHPGSIMTDLGRHMTGEMNHDLEEYAANTVFKTQDQGAATTLVAAFDPKLKTESGVYLDDCQMGEAREWATAEPAADRLWALSEELVGQKFVL